VSVPQARDPAKLRERAFAIVKARSFVRGDVVLSSGERSTYYFDMKPSMFDAEGAEILSELLLERVAQTGCDFVGGLEMGAVPLISPIAAKSYVAGKPIRGFFVRKEAKGHGTKKRIEGVAAGELQGKRVAIVEDVTTTGRSALVAVKELQAAGAQIVLVISILDRQQGAADLYKAEGLPFQSLFTASEFLSAA
jgi:orotate phosphoribosyltransferase